MTTEIRLDPQQQKYVKTLIAIRDLAKEIFGTMAADETVFEMHGTLAAVGATDTDHENWGMIRECFLVAGKAAREVFGTVSPETFFTVLYEFNPDLVPDAEEPEEEPEPAPRAKKGGKK